MSDTPVQIQLTSAQVESIVRVAQEQGSGGVAMLLPELLLRRELPTRALWEQRMRELDENNFSLSLAHGLMLLGLLAGGRVASAEELAEELGSAAIIISRYLRTLALAGLVEREPDASRYRVVS